MDAGMVRRLGVELQKIERRLVWHERILEECTGVIELLAKDPGLTDETREALAKRAVSIRKTRP